MEKHFTVITSDANRNTLNVAYCQDPSAYIHQLNKAIFLTTNFSPIPSRIVYVEELATRTEAEYRKNQIQAFTKMQKEKLIRRKNPNWLSISLTPIHPSTDRSFINL